MKRSCQSEIDKQIVDVGEAVAPASVIVAVDAGVEMVEAAVVAVVVAVAVVEVDPVVGKAAEEAGPEEDVEAALFLVVDEVDVIARQEYV